MKAQSIHQKLIKHYGIKVEKLPRRLVDSITTYQRLHGSYLQEWKRQHSFIDHENLTDEEVEKVRVFLDKKRQFKDGDRSYSQLLSEVEAIGKGREGEKHILYIDGERGYPVPSYIYNAVFNVRPSLNEDSTNYSAMLQQADRQITQGLIRFLHNHQHRLDYYLSDIAELPSTRQGASIHLKRWLYDTMLQLVPDLIQLPICTQYQTTFQEGKAYQIACISKSSEASYFDLIELGLHPKRLTTYKAAVYTFYVQENELQPILAVQYDKEGKITSELEVIQVMGGKGKGKDEQIEQELLNTLEVLLKELIKEDISFKEMPSTMQLILKQFEVMKNQH